MYTRRKRCLPTFHSTSTTSSPSERATRSAAARTFSKFTQRLPDLSRSDALPNRRQQKSGLAPTLSCDPFPSEGRVYSHCTAKARYARIWRWVRLDFTDRDAKVEVQAETQPRSYARSKDQPGIC